jgi:hypothetical protein
MRCLGQMSLEYLLLLLALLAIFAALLPLVDSTYKAGIFGLDCVNAKRFTQALQARAEEMAFQADGSYVLIEARPLEKWRISSSGKALSLIVIGPDERQKAFAVVFPNSIGRLDFAIGGATTFALRRESGKITLEYNQ